MNIYIYIYICVYYFLEGIIYKTPIDWPKHRSGGCACAVAFTTKLPISRVPLEISKNGSNFGVFYRGLYFAASFYWLKRIGVGGAREQQLSVQNCQYLEYRWRYRKTVEILGFSKGVCNLWLLFIG